MTWETSPHFAEGIWPENILDEENRYRWAWRVLTRYNHLYFLFPIVLTTPHL